MLNMFQLPLTKIIIGAFLIPWWNRQHFLSALALPTLLLVCIWGVWTLFPQGESIIASWIFYLIYSFGGCIFAITCHRVMLIEHKHYGEQFKIRISSREFKFAVFLIGVYILFSLAHVIPMTFAINIFSELIFDNVSIIESDSGKISEPNSIMAVVQFITSLPAIYILGRFSLVFPAIAIDQKCTLKQSWMHTKNNGLKMFVIVGVMPWILGYLISLLWREGQTIIEQAFIAIIMYIVMAIEIFALSLAYKEIKSSGEITSNIAKTDSE